MSSSSSAADTDSTFTYDPRTTPPNKKLQLISDLFAQKQQRNYREQRKLESEIYCRPQIHSFAMCIQSNTYTAPFVCRSIHRSMIACLHEYLTHDTLDIRLANFNRHNVFDDETKSASYVTPEELDKFNQDIEQYKAQHNVK